VESSNLSWDFGFHISDLVRHQFDVPAVSFERVIKGVFAKNGQKQFKAFLDCPQRQ